MTKTRMEHVYNKRAAWSGYGESYVQNIISGANKVLTLLATLTFDVGLLYWVSGLKRHLEQKIKEAEKEKADIARKYNFR